MSGPWLYSGVDQAWASETNPIQKIGTEPARRSTNHRRPGVFSAGMAGLSS